MNEIFSIINIETGLELAWEDIEKLGWEENLWGGRMYGVVITADGELLLADKLGKYELLDEEKYKIEWHIGNKAYLRKNERKDILKLIKVFSKLLKEYNHVWGTKESRICDKVIGFLEER